MALRFVDSFDHWAIGDALEKYSAASTASCSIGTGRNSTSSFRGAGVNNASLSRSLDNQASWVVGLAIKWTGFSVNTGPFIALLDSATSQCDLRVTSGGELQVTRGGTQLAITSGLGLTTGAWYFIEFKVTIDNAGSYAVRVNGSAVAALTGSGDTQAGSNAYANIIRIGMFPGGGGGGTFDIDDLYVLDGQAGLNDFLGDCRVKCVLPDGDGNYTAWTASAGSDYQCVDETTPNDDTDYISSSNATDRASFTYGAVGVTGNVKGVQLCLSARKDDAGTRTIQHSTRISSTDYDGASVNVADGYAYYPKVWENSPATSSAWTVAEIDGAEFGVELVS
jgi:hypothetical protein